MTDRELLELAAKAAGYEYTVHHHGGQDYSLAINGVYWYPLYDDGDALRLAVKIGEPFVVRTRCVTTMGGLIENFDPDLLGDDLRATRRAIVRAAAEIGKDVK